MSTYEERLFDDIRQGKVNLLREFVGQGGAVKPLRDDNGASLLHVAVECGHTPIVIELIEAGASLSAVDKRGYTPLHAAVKLGFGAIVKHLLSLGAPVDVETNEGNRVEMDYTTDKPVLRILMKFGASVRDSKVHNHQWLRDVSKETDEIIFLGDATIKAKMDELGMK